MGFCALFNEQEQFLKLRKAGKAGQAPFYRFFLFREGEKPKDFASVFGFAGFFFGALTSSVQSSRQCFIACKERKVFNKGRTLDGKGSPS